MTIKDIKSELDQLQVTYKSGQRKAYYEDLLAKHSKGAKKGKSARNEY